MLRLVVSRYLIESGAFIHEVHDQFLLIVAIGEDVGVCYMGCFAVGGVQVYEPSLRSRPLGYIVRAALCCLAVTGTAIRTAAELVNDTLFGAEDTDCEGIIDCIGNKNGTGDVHLHLLGQRIEGGFVYFNNE